MDIGSIFLILALLIIVVLFIIRPLYEPASTRTGDAAAILEDHKRSSLMAERDRVLNALQELDFDYALGKIPEEDYPAQRSRLLEYGARVLHQLDEIDAAKQSRVEGKKDSVEQRIEATVAARRADAAKTPVALNRSAATGGNGARGIAASQPDDELEALLANRRRSRQEKSSGFCPKCGKPQQQSDKFCPKCGIKVG